MSDDPAANDSPGAVTSAAAPRRQVGWTAASLALLTSALWGGNAVAVSFTVDTLPPIAVAAIRFAMAVAVMVVWRRVERGDMMLRSGEWVPSIVSGVLLFVQISLFNIGVRMSSSSHAAMFVATYIFWVAAIEHLVTGHDRLSARKVLGLSVAAGGVLLILSSTGAVAQVDAEGALASAAIDTPTLAGDFVLLVSAALLGVKVVYVKHAIRVVEPGKLILWHDIIGVLLFVILSAATEQIEPGGFTTAAMLGLFYQGVFVAGLCFAIQAMLLRRHSASQIAIFSFATPLFGVVLGVLLRGDRLSGWLAAAAACVTVGIYLVTVGPKRGS